jgi:hypothetical protein
MKNLGLFVTFYMNLHSTKKWPLHRLRLRNTDRNCRISGVSFEPDEILIRQRLEQELVQVKQEYRERAADLELNTSQNGVGKITYHNN